MKQKKEKKITQTTEEVKEGVQPLTPLQHIILKSVLQGIGDVDEKHPDAIDVMIGINWKTNEIKVHVDYRKAEEKQESGLIVLKPKLLRTDGNVKEPPVIIKP